MDSVKVQEFPVYTYVANYVYEYLLDNILQLL